MPSPETHRREHVGPVEPRAMLALASRVGSVAGLGEFEPVGTHPGHLRHGLARAACVAVLHAFAAAGGTRAVVYARGDAAYPVPMALYTSLGFRPYTRARMWCRSGATRFVGGA
ncbi:hypothetical protein [Actinophytocola sp.]|uniref:GNAT family N-acetyltransferase n=1 Tax=Actinophytocola sp. TaxID=1872138 RepID=UPI0025C6B30E|nr:hypothetical protein [Actinophytocola sp.]